MDDLPHDVLAHIFLCTPLWPRQKLAIRAVSRRLRRAALDTPLLWSSIEIRSPHDLGYLELFLVYSRNALFNVSVHPYGYASMIAPDRLVAALLPHVARLRSLTVDLKTVGPLAPLLSADLFFEHLEKLAVSGTDHVRISLSAPQLQVVKTSAYYVEDLAALAARPRDLTMTLSSSTNVQRFMDRLVSNGSQTLRRLTLTQDDADSAPLVGPWIFQTLQHLGLEGESASTVQILRGISTTHIPYVRVGLTDFIDPEQDYDTIVLPALAQLLTGVRTIAEFRIDGVTECSVLSSTGQERSFELVCSVREEVLHYIWSYLCDHFDARYTVTSCRLSTSMFSLYQATFAGRAPAAPKFILRVKRSYSTEYSDTLELPTLAKVMLLGNSTYLPGVSLKITLSLDDHQDVILQLATGALKCDRSDVELCTCDVSRLTERETELALRKWVQQESEHGGSLTAEAGCVIRWILCSGNCV